MIKKSTLRLARDALFNMMKEHAWGEKMFKAGIYMECNIRDHEKYTKYKEAAEEIKNELAIQQSKR